MNYNRKNQALARRHVQSLKAIIYKDWIKDSIDKSKIYEDLDLCLEPSETPTMIKVKNLDVVTALFKYGNHNTAVLNFADFVKPGGAFLEGGTAQEEALCHSSTLYPVLTGHQKDYYDVNAEDLNNHLYRNRALYSPDILFTNGRSKHRANVITCAAPNLNEAEKVEGFKIDENNKAMYERIKLVIQIALDNGIDTLILGAWGCGVFGQDTLTVARLFKYVIEQHCGISNIIFAIKDSKKYNTFVQVFYAEDVFTEVAKLLNMDVVQIVEDSEPVEEVEPVDENGCIVRVGDHIETPRLLFAEGELVPEGTLCKVTRASDGTLDLLTPSGKMIIGFAI